VLRILLLTILNLSLPFLLRTAWLVFLELRRQHFAKKGMTTNPVKWHFPWARLLAIGLVLLATTLFAARLMTPNEVHQTGNPAVTREY